MGDFSTCGFSGLVLTTSNIFAAALLLPASTHVESASGQEPLAVPREHAEGMMALLKDNRTLSLLSVIVFLDFLAEQMLVSLLLLYLEAEFHVSSLQLGMQLAVVGATASVSLLVVVPWLQPRWHGS